MRLAQAQTPPPAVRGPRPPTSALWLSKAGSRLRGSSSGVEMASTAHAKCSQMRMFWPGKGRQGAALPDPNGPSLPWGTACPLLREAFERRCDWPPAHSSLQTLAPAGQGTRSAFMAPGNVTRTPPKIQTGGGKMWHSWRGPASHQPLGLNIGLVSEEVVPKSSTTHSTRLDRKCLFLAVPFLHQPDTFLCGGPGRRFCKSQNSHLEGTRLRKACQRNPRQNCLVQLPAQRPRCSSMLGRCQAKAAPLPPALEFSIRILRIFPRPQQGKGRSTDFPEEPGPESRFMQSGERWSVQKGQ